MSNREQAEEPDPSETDSIRDASFRLSPDLNNDPRLPFTFGLMTYVL